MRNDRERRFVTTNFEFRSIGDTAYFEGYALKWNTRSQNLGGFYETIAPGATAKTIQEADIRALFNHDPNLVLGRNRSGTLTLTEDNTGLAYRVDMPNTTYAQDLAESMRRGDVSQSSFGFRTIDDEWSIDENNDVIRTLREIALFDVSPVTYPAYLDTESGVSTAVRSLEAAIARGLAVPAHVVESLRATKEPYGDVNYADPGFLDKDGKQAKDGNGVKRYPINTAEHVKAAWSYVHVASNAAQYSPDQLKHIQDAISQAAKHFGIKLSEKPSGRSLVVLERATRAATDTDDDPGKIAQAVDAAIDEALEILNGDGENDGGVAQATALIQAADLAVDHLLKVLGVPDPDEAAEGDDTEPRSGLSVVEIPVVDFAKRGIFIPRNR